MLREDDSPYYDAKIIRVDCISILELMNCCQVFHFDLIKLDCEGSEFQILEKWPQHHYGIARQISVEFHDGTPSGPNRTEIYYADLFAKLGYRVIQHEVTKQGDWIGHWDTVLG